MKYFYSFLFYFKFIKIFKQGNIRGKNYEHPLIKHDKNFVHLHRECQLSYLSLLQNRLRKIFLKPVKLPAFLSLISFNDFRCNRTCVKSASPHWGRSFSRFWHLYTLTHTCLTHAHTYIYEQAHSYYNYFIFFPFITCNSFANACIIVCLILILM